MVASMLSHMTTAVSDWITAMVEEGGPPMKPFIPIEELVGDE